MIELALRYIRGMLHSGGLGVCCQGLLVASD